jgi:tetratricopeptide (TPR) repeat protein
VDEAIACWRKAIELNPKHAGAHSNLGAALAGKGQVDEAIACYHKAIRLRPDTAEPHCNLGDALRRQGRFAESLDAYRRGHELGSKQPKWPYPSAQWVRDAERLVELERKLPKILKGDKRPADAAEAAGLAAVATAKKRYATAARLYREALADDPKLADDPQAGHRYDAACAAALAGTGQGQDGPGLDAAARAGWRRQALAWLRADLDAWRRRLENAPDTGRPAIASRMQHWLADPDFAGVRGQEALSRLSAAERLAWQKLWADVARTRDRALARPAPK